MVKGCDTLELVLRTYLVPATDNRDARDLASMDVMKVQRRRNDHAPALAKKIAKQRTPHLHRDSLSKALRDAGLQGKQTPCGLRATLRTVARERLGISADVLEAQLAHAKRGEVQSAYDTAGFVEERDRVMQAWADHLDGSARDTVIPIRRAHKTA